MSRTVELGRAVLFSPNTSQELWLTTLITILPKQNETYLQQLRSASLLEKLSSGYIWVGRGHGMHLELTLTLGQEPLDRRQLQSLAENLLGAPVSETVRS